MKTPGIAISRLQSWAAARQGWPGVVRLGPPLPALSPQSLAGPTS